MYDYDGHRKNLKSWLSGMKYYEALEAMRIAQARHENCFRKDGKTVEFSHQITLAQHARTLNSCLLYPEETIAVLLLHDIPEDKQEGRILIKDFSPVVQSGVESMTKFYYPNYDQEKSEAQYYGALSEDPIGSIAKLIDRSHNLQTMVGVFSDEKQRKYIKEVEDHILPMGSRARERFRRQEDAYHNVKHTILCQIELIKARLDNVPGGPIND